MPQTRADTLLPPIAASGAYRVNITADPIGMEGGINPFTYVENNPVINADPFGLSKIIQCGPCTIRIESDPHKGKHAHWECHGGSTGCIKPNGDPCENSGQPPARVRECLEKNGFLPAQKHECSNLERDPITIPGWVAPVAIGAGVITVCIFCPEYCFVVVPILAR